MTQLMDMKSSESVRIGVDRISNDDSSEVAHESLDKGDPISSFTCNIDPGWYCGFRNVLIKLSHRPKTEERNEQCTA